MYRTLRSAPYSVVLRCPGYTGTSVSSVRSRVCALQWNPPTMSMTISTSLIIGINDHAKRSPRRERRQRLQHPQQGADPR
jgi:hypothetical protein